MTAVQLYVSHPRCRAWGMPSHRKSVLPLNQFPEDMRLAILEAVAQPTPPPKWLVGELASIESRAWYEWHWARGLDPARSRSSLSPSKRAQVIARDGYVCGLCGGEVEPDDVHIDHIHPVVRGGSDALQNLQVSHSRCNLAKGAR